MHRDLNLKTYKPAHSMYDENCTVNSLLNTCICYLCNNNFNLPLITVICFHIHPGSTCKYSNSGN